jgi:hypothetical protein
MIKRLLKIILVPILMILSPIELVYHIIAWLFTGKSIPYPFWFYVLIW